jgi:hypothetical protein
MRTLKKRLVILLLFVITVLLFSCKDKVTDPSQSSNDFKGIINDESGNPISDVSVYIIYDGSTLMKSLIMLSDTLPVELSAFTATAQGSTVVLNWITKTEKNSDRFDVERSLDPFTVWSKIASIKASVLSNSQKNYSYSDKNLQSGKYQYRLKMVDLDGSFAYSSVEAVEVVVPVPKDFAVSQNYPNPFNPSTKIDYQIPVDAKVVMDVYNIAGQKVFELVNQEQSAGYYTVDFDASKLSSGVYIYRLSVSDKATGNTDSLESKMCKFESDPTQLAITEANTISSSNGKFTIPYDNFYINAEYVRTGPDSPESIGTYKITNNPTIVLIKSGYQPLVKKITVDNSSNAEESFVLTKIK